MGDSKKNKIKRYFFVDMENVHRDGLKGVEDLTSKDCVRIYYSNPLENVPMYIHKQIVSSKARFEYIQVDMPIKNAADCMILFDLQAIAGENEHAEFFIISKDSDFDRPIVDFCEKKFKVKKLPEISGKENKQKEAEVREFIDKHFNDIEISGDREEIIAQTVRAIVHGKTRSQVNNSLMKIYDHDSIKMIFNEIKPLIKDLPGK